MTIEYSEGRGKDIARPEFSIVPVQDKAASAREGRPIFHDREMVKIRIPGDRLIDWDGEVDDAIRARFPEAYAAFKRGETRSATGTPLDEWPPLTKSRVYELKASGIMTVEEYADVPDGVLGKLGMNAREEREKARVYIKNAKDNAASSALAAENADLKRRLEALEAAMMGRADAPASIPAESKPIEECTDEELKAFIKRETGDWVRGTPSRETLIRKANEIALSKAEIA